MHTSHLVYDMIKAMSLNGAFRTFLVEIQE